MNNEPLKNKLLKCDVGYKVIDKEYRHLFDIDAVKSAVVGLQHDIKHEKEFIIFPRVGRKALKLVKKWFPDAIDNKTNQK